MENKIDYEYFSSYSIPGSVQRLNNTENVMLLEIDSDRIKVITEEGIIKSILYSQINHVRGVGRVDDDNFRASLQSHHYRWNFNLQTLECLIKPGDLIIGGNGEVYYVDNIDDLITYVKVKELRLRDSIPYPHETDTWLVRNCNRVIHTSKLSQL